MMYFTPTVSFVMILHFDSAEQNIVVISIDSFQHLANSRKIHIANFESDPCPVCLIFVFCFFILPEVSFNYCNLSLHVILNMIYE